MGSNLEDIDLTGAVDPLEPGATGAWLVHSRTSTHFLDFDKRLYMRFPGGDAMTMPYDLQPIALLRVDRWPKVGGQMLVWTDADEARLLEQWRICATIKAITPAETRKSG